jgi:L-lactate dehydrogenase complex protein LldE
MPLPPKLQQLFHPGSSQTWALARYGNGPVAHRPLQSILSRRRRLPVKIALMVTCLGDVIRPAAPQSVVHILRRLGHSIDFPATQTCCGQPMFNSGFADLARQQAQHTIAVFEPYDVIVTPSGSCAAMVKVEYPHLLEEQASWHARATELSSKLFEFTDFLVNRLNVVDVGARYSGKVTYHFACHLRMLNLQNEVEKLLQHVQGATYVPLQRQEQCCGFGGSFAIRYPDISGSMVDDKMKCVLETGADAVVSTDTGCLMNIGGRLHREGKSVEVLHIAELLNRR